MGIFDILKNDIKSEWNKQMEQSQKIVKGIKSGGKDIWRGTCKYLGGHPDIKGQGEGSLKIKSSGIFFNKGLQQFYIPITDVIKVEGKTEEQISKDVTLTRLIALGIFAFGLKKKRIDKYTYLIITYSDCEIENTIIFESDEAQTISGSIIKARQQQE